MRVGGGGFHGGMGMGGFHGGGMMFHGGPGFGGFHGAFPQRAFAFNHGRFFFHNHRRFFFAGAPFVGLGYYGGYGYDYCQPWWNGWQWVYPGYACGGYGYGYGG
jgi:hypothetical protein